MEDGVCGNENGLGRVERRVVDQKESNTRREGENCSGLGVGEGLAPASVSMPADAAPVGADAQSAPVVKHETDPSPPAATPAIKQEKNPSRSDRNASNSDPVASIAKAYANMNTQVLMLVVSS